MQNYALIKLKTNKLFNPHPFELNHYYEYLTLIVGEFIHYYTLLYKSCLVCTAKKRQQFPKAYKKY